MPDAAREEVLAAAKALHARIVTAHAAYRRSERDLAILLAGMADDRLHEALGYGSVHDYAAVVLDLSPRHSASLVRIGRRLPDLPALDAAFARGDLGWTKARELLRVATPANEAAWVDRAVGLSSRELERHVADAKNGEPPPFDQVGKEPSRRRVVFEMDAQDADVLRAAIAAVRAKARASDGEIEDGAILAEIARRWLHEMHETDAPTAERYRVVLERCPACALTTGLRAEVNDTQAGMAGCDGEVQHTEGEARGRLSREIPTATRRAAMHRDQWRCAVPGCSNDLWLDVHHVVARHNGGTHHEDNLVTLCCVHHRVVHEGLMAIRRAAGGFEFKFLDGRVANTAPRRSARRKAAAAAPDAKAPGGRAAPDAHVGLSVRERRRLDRGPRRR